MSRNEDGSRPWPVMRAPARGKWDTLIAKGVVSAEEFALATRVARRRCVDVEMVLDEDLRLEASVLGEALAHFYGVPYEPFRPDRERPVDLLGAVSRHFAASNGWVALEATKDGLLILATDPKRAAMSGAVESLYPGSKPVYRVCTGREFNMTLDQMLGAIFLD